MDRRAIIFLIVVISTLLAVVVYKQRFPKGVTTEDNKDTRIVSGSFDLSKVKTDDEWRKILTPQQFHILREAGTELPFTGDLDKEYRAGVYYSVGCDVPLFSSETKYDSKTGWPSFWAPINLDSVVLRKQYDLLGEQIEVLDRCGGHLGHVFGDGPPPTGKRYCMNSAALRFVPDTK